MKTCNKCLVKKELSGFHKKAQSSDGLTRECKACRCADQTTRRRADPQKHRDSVRRARNANKEAYAVRRRTATYGIAPDKYAQLIERQVNRCAICAGPPTGRGSLHVDHDHGTGKVRGLLCHGCNVSLGHFRDNPALLLRAVAYLSPEE